jgi:Flp pilus assembly protein TadG
VTHRPRQRRERGAVTAELAMALPLLVAVTIGLVWLLSIGATQLRVVDGARETARAVARGDDEGAAIALGQRVAPEGAAFTVSGSGQEVHVEVSARAEGPGGLFGFLPAVMLQAEAVTTAEESS